MDKEFSEGFKNDLIDILQYCSDNNSSSCELEFEVGEKILIVNFSFEIK